MRHMLTTLDWPRDELSNVLARARSFRREPFSRDLAGCALGVIGLGPRPRAATDLDVAAYHLRGLAVNLTPPSPPEFALEDGAVMDGEAVEHVRDLAKLAEAQCDVIAINARQAPGDPALPNAENVIRAMARDVEVPVLNAGAHLDPLGELALIMTLQDRLGVTDGKTFTLAWTPHTQPVDIAEAHSALLIAAKFGFHIRLLAPSNEYLLDRQYMDLAAEEADANMRAVSVTADAETAYDGADVVYPISWGAPSLAGRWRDETALRRKLGLARFQTDEAKMGLTHEAAIVRSLPIRRNVELSDAVLASPGFAGYDMAENRVHVAKAVLARLFTETE